MDRIRIRPADPTDPAIRPIVESHLAFTRSVTPPESCHALGPEALGGPDVRFFALLEDDRPLGIGAFKRLGEGRAELKSMHVLAAARGRGLAERMVRHLEAEARAGGVTVVMLETGSDRLPAFDPARRLYERLGYTPCPPIPGYVEDPLSVFLQRAL
ncbi:GNAT family N-acetyltransferase [Roseicyclus persicicus]|uniref:GNAT family N-acetyltransferase n=1 Tax=Roseicyclus persicicus TaxID=2650661 RepID=A0A7X6JW34_9RHOB|nr:GNAT family N-acetyltransferase [Roseibacterium persicicum]NKX43290.1 GNAT family N-acetyltransferase [Roseibacterium persicicum]